MKEWEYAFDPVSRAAWHQQIENDLKGKSINSLERSWWPGEPLIPMHHKEDGVGTRIVLPSKLFASPPAILEYVDTGSLSSSEINTQLLSSLQFGAQKIILDTNDAGLPEREEWLHGIHPEMIEWHVQSDRQDLYIPEILQRKAPTTSFIRINRKADREESGGTLTGIFKNRSWNTLPVKFEYIIPSAGVWDAESAMVFKSIQTDLNEWISAGLDGSDFLDRCILRLHADRDYLKHIIQTRVIHLVWHNLYVNIASGKQPGDDYLECHVIPETDEVPEMFLIRASVSSLAAVLTGSASVCVHHATDKNVPYFYKRINRNIHHLLHLESGLPKTADPLSGAWSIDYYTQRWTEMIWSRLSGG